MPKRLIVSKVKETGEITPPIMVIKTRWDEFKEKAIRFLISLALLGIGFLLGRCTN
jgi:hypothetical protein